MNKFSSESGYSNLENKEEEIDLREILFKYILHWRWFVLSAIVFLIIGGFLYI